MIAIYPGSFDPITNGHLDIIKRASKVVDNLVVAVLCNGSKRPLFSTEERVEMIKAACHPFENVDVQAFSGLLVDFAKQTSAKVIIRGLRATADFENEFKMAITNKALSDNIETLFLPTSLQYSYISSSMVKEVASLGGDVSFMVPNVVEKKILQKIASI
ncbi:MAG: pantetheine-phosphate adenylyltransferase [Defluviitaleaceae bacterium]|nr:pantetheine-phosphate adenylyltransferase [Defluviitaleaceae bacterium]